MTTGLAESNGSLLPGDDLQLQLTACTSGLVTGPMLGNEYGKIFVSM